MGVHGLWTILGPVARPVKLESLHGKRLAVDASIWIYHFLKAVRDKEGNALPNAHIVGFFRRICKLIFYGILPVFVFDGDAPMIKKQTIAGRKQRRQGREEDASRTANKLLSLQMQRLAEEEVSGGSSTRKETEVDGQKVVYFDELNMTDAERKKRRDAAAKASPKKFRRQDPYHLPEQEMAFSKDDPRMMTEDELAKYAEEYKDADDVGLYDTTNIDFQSAEFAALPMTVQYQLLNTARLRSRLRMGYSKEQLDQIFPDRLEFSKFQIARVKERNMLTQKLFNLNGMAEDLSMRVAGERDKEYVLKKNENGWTLALEDASASQPIRIDEAEDGSADDEDDDDDWEDVPLQPAYKTSLPRPDQLTRGNFILPGIYGNAQESEEVRSDETGNPLFLSDNEEDEDFVLDLDAGDADSELQAAIAMSLESEKKESTPQIEVEMHSASSSDDEQEQEKESEAVTAGPFLFDTGDMELDDIIKNLPKLPASEPEPEPAADEPAQDAKEVEQERTVPKVRFSSSRFSMKNSIFNRKRNRDAVTDGEERANGEVAEPEVVPEPKRVMTEEMRTPEKALEMDAHVIKIEEDLQPTVHVLSDDEDLKSDVKDADIAKNTEVEKFVVLSDDEKELQTKKEEPTPESDAKAAETSAAAEEEDERESSPDWEDVPVATSVAAEATEALNLPTTAGTSDVPATARAASPDWEVPSSPANSEEDNGGEEDEEANIDFDEEEDAELVKNIVHEVQEHARFASEINPHSRRVEYEREIQELRNQQRHDRRDADTVTNVMVQECQELLARFGIPYITAPMEAEAQCAELLRLGLVDGVITDDSDIFLFGASKVYKNMFNQSKFVECYLSSDVQKELDLDQRRLIELAHLLGSDYTPGIPGVGPVTAVQLLRDFESDHSLEDFKAWYDSIQRGDTSADVSTPFRKKFKKKSKKLFLNPVFPEKAVNEAYLKPTVDRDDTQFVWGTPDLDRIREYLMSAIGWSKERADEVLVPLIKTMNLKRQSLQFSRRGFGAK
ncbi:DNA excision repair protein Rad2 [Myxozyma melibiosi]|uniref:DNA excision repair protein Rad2 n=1 Tax=Myxozyma melibiosi TaxID=54550 RepID=A0ABR1F5R9_9ASCO